MRPHKRAIDDEFEGSDAVAEVAIGGGLGHPKDDPSSIVDGGCVLAGAIVIGGVGVIIEGGGVGTAIDLILATAENKRQKQDGNGKQGNVFRHSVKRIKNENILGLNQNVSKSYTESNSIHQHRLYFFCLSDR